MERRSALIAIAVVVVLIVLSVAVWEFALRDLFVSEDTEYKISISYLGGSLAKIRMSELEGLPEYSYPDVHGSGVNDSGPLLSDVILLRLDPSDLANDTMIRISSSLTIKDRTLSWGELSNESNLYILDFTKRGTVKFTSPDTERNQRVKDVTDIEVGV